MNSIKFLLETMKEICPNIVDDITTYWDQPITEYARHIGCNTEKTKSTISLDARNILIKRIIKYIKNNKLNISEVEFKENFEKNPVCQTGPHAQLYLDPMNFNAILLGLMSAIQNKQTYLFVLNSSLVTLQSTSGTGPAWINCQNQNIKTVSLSNTKLKKTSVCCIKKNILEINIENSLKSNFEENEFSGINLIERCISKNANLDLSDSFTHANTSIIRMLGSFEPIIIDERQCADIITDHLENENSLLYSLIFNQKRREKILNLFKKLKTQKFGNFLATGTDLFWFIGNNKIKKIVIEDNILSVEDGTKIPITPEYVIQALRNKIILPSMFLSYLVIGLLPNVKVQGGTRMIAYYPIFKNILLECLDNKKSDELDFYLQLSKSNNYAWGANVIQNDLSPIKQLGILSDFNPLSYYNNITLKNATRELRSFQNHPRWEVAMTLRDKT